MKTSVTRNSTARLTCRRSHVSAFSDKHEKTVCDSKNWQLLPCTLFGSDERKVRQEVSPSAHKHITNHGCLVERNKAMCGLLWCPTVQEREKRIWTKWSSIPKRRDSREGGPRAAQRILPLLPVANETRERGQAHSAVVSFWTRFVAHCQRLDGTSSHRAMFLRCARLWRVYIVDGSDWPVGNARR